MKPKKVYSTFENREYYRSIHTQEFYECVKCKKRCKKEERKRHIDSDGCGIYICPYCGKADFYSFKYAKNKQ